MNSVASNPQIQKILALEAAMLAMPERRIDLVTLHHFAPGIYLRELRIPKGVTLTGKIHKTEHLNILSQGEMEVWTEDGMKLLSASTVIKSKPGIKRAGYAHEDSVWITVHPNVADEINFDDLEKSLVTDTYDEFLGFMEQKRLGGS